MNCIIIIIIILRPDEQQNLQLILYNSQLLCFRIVLQIKYLIFKHPFNYYVVNAIWHSLLRIHEVQILLAFEPAK